MRYLLIISLLLFGFSSQAQNKKEIRNKKIKTVTVWTTDANSDHKYKESEEAYNKDGQLLLKVEYEKDGGIRKKETATFDGAGNKTAETFYCPKEGRNEKTTWKYNVVNDKLEETEYNGSGKVVKRTTFSYNANGDKVSETVFDGSGVVLKKMTYTYNNKKLKEIKQTFDASGKLESTKAYSYEYY